MIQTVILRFFLFQKWFGTEFQGFSHPKIVRNGIPEVFLFREMVQNGILRDFLSSGKWFGMEFWGFSSEKWFGTDFQGFFSSEKWFRMDWGFSLPRNRRNSDRTAVCSVLFCILRNNLLLENGNSNTRGVLTPHGQYIGESWPPVVDFLMYFEQASEQVYNQSKKSCDTVPLKGLSQKMTFTAYLVYKILKHWIDTQISIRNKL